MSKKDGPNVNHNYHLKAEDQGAKTQEKGGKMGF